MKCPTCKQEMTYVGSDVSHNLANPSKQYDRAVYRCINDGAFANTEIPVISPTFDTLKKSAMLLVVCNDTILLQKGTHQDAVIYDGFGSFLQDGDPYPQIMAVQKEQFGTELALTNCGTTIAYINKPQPDGRVQLNLVVYVLRINEDHKELFASDDTRFWARLSDFEHAPEVREDDRLIFKRVLAGETLDITLEIDQMGRWIDAKLVAWRLS